jgi:hypothetical protein
MLEALLTKLSATPLNTVPPVPPLKNLGEPLQATNGAAVPPVPPVPPQKTETKTENKTAALSAAESSLIKCGDCLHFKCFNQHGRGAGHCLVGGDYGLWSETLH